jgi:hypothetical protein
VFLLVDLDALALERLRDVGRSDDAVARVSFFSRSIWRLLLSVTARAS